ncbi:MAG TPA: hypothetical protein PKD61_15605, partial [Polyangiaceae bacterium]|nr:hypothetical protein [Polyangiaceae bacterium]
APITALALQNKILYAGSVDGQVVRVPAVKDSKPTALAKLGGPILALANEGNVLFALVAGAPKTIVRIGAPQSCCQ